MLSLTREELPIEEEIEIPSERPTAPFKAHEYSVISSQPPREVKTPIPRQDSSLTTLKDELTRKRNSLEEQHKQLRDLEARVVERRKLVTLCDNTAALAKEMPAENQNSQSEILAYETAIESLSRSIGSQSRRLKEYEGHIARRQHQVSETKLRLDDLKLDCLRNSAKRKELHRIVFAHRRLLAQPSFGWQSASALLILETGLKLTEFEGELDVQLADAISAMHSLKEELTKPSFTAIQIRALHVQIKAEMSRIHSSKTPAIRPMSQRKPTSC